MPFLTGSNESGPPGSGVAFAANIRGVDFGGLQMFNGIGPFGLPGGTTTRDAIYQASAADQFSLCCDNLLWRLNESDSTLIDLNTSIPVAAKPSLNQARVIFLHISHISYLPEIDARWAQRFNDTTAAPLRSVMVHPIRGGAKVEMDVLVANFHEREFRIEDHGVGNVPDEYVNQLLTPTADSDGWKVDLAAGQYRIVNEEEINNQDSRLLIDDGRTDIVAAGALMFARHNPDDSVNGWQGHTNYAKTRPAAQVVATPQYFFFDATTSPQQFTATLSGWDIAGQLDSYQVSPTGYTTNWPSGATATDNANWTATFNTNASPIWDGQSWFYFRVHGPSGWSNPAKVHGFWMTNWGISL